MKNPNLILATDQEGNDISLKQVEEWLKSADSKQLSQLFYDRFYGRYLRPFDFQNKEYKKKYKNGFAIMTSCCLLIETFVSFTEPIFRNTKGKSERCFGYFFLTNSDFTAFSKNGLTITEYKDLERKPLKNKGTPDDFYKNLRCGILHNGETRNGWKISRTGDFYDEANKKINAVKFMDKVIDSINHFKNQLNKSDFEKSEIWKSYKGRLQDLIDNS